MVASICTSMLVGERISRLVSRVAEARWAKGLGGLEVEVAIDVWRRLRCACPFYTFWLALKF